MSEQRPVALAPVEEPGDAELISAVRAGDADAYGLLFERHVGAARRLARQLVSAGDVDDLVSEAFAKVLSVLQRGGGPDLAFRAYLLTSVRRLHVDKIRSGRRLSPVDDLTPYDPGVPFEDTAVSGFENATAARAFASLPERWQQVLWHTEVERQKPAEVAQLLGMTPNSVSALAYRAREGLRQAFITMHAQDVVDEKCAATRANLGAYLRGGLSRRDSAKVEAHLRECRPCAAIYLELAEVNADLGAVLAPVLLGSAGAGYLAASQAAAAAAAKGGALLALDRGKDWVAHNPAGRATGGVAAAAVVAVAVLAGLRLANGPGPPSAEPSNPGTTGAVAPSGAPTTGPTQTAPPSPAPTATHPAHSAPRLAPPLLGPPVVAAGGRSNDATTATVPFSQPLSTFPTRAAPTSAPPTGSGSSNPVPTNRAPRIVHPLADVSLAPESRSVTIDVTRGARDPDGDPLHVRSTHVRGHPRHGTVSIGGAHAPSARSVAADRPHHRTVTYTPRLSWRGAETIVYTLADGHGGSVTGHVRVITPNRAPVAMADRATTPAGDDRAVVVDVLANDSDPNGDVLTLAAGLTREPTHGTVTRAGAGYRYVPAETFDGTDSFSYAITDGHGGRATATVTVTVVRPHADLTLTSDHPADPGEGVIGFHFRAAGIPPGRQARFTATITGFGRWTVHAPEHGGEPCTEDQQGTTMTVVCTVRANIEFLHADFRPAGAFTVDARLDPVDFDGASGVLHREGPGPDGVS
ncbi:sigma-70 family RNA polymerase sigma factor [Nocardioides sp. CER19]|uniref:sigma-70 family RNA polymerase sigma factor n=1 Tax=Nocardioides sp. CER19 TaxID=3038538 RepID=UPI00244822AE|nr:sigma-70 family RNA polymerase sigma factor [Nocardioides sp. CER19]MDH2415332.1 sigma-70 family RNA polymerase sigma factor [Nocardioides sp. CER19]